MSSKSANRATSYRCANCIHTWRKPWYHAQTTSPHLPSLRLTSDIMSILWLVPHETCGKIAYGSAYFTVYGSISYEDLGSRFD